VWRRGHRCSAPPLGFGFEAASLGERRVLAFGPIERLLVRHRAGPREDRQLGVAEELIDRRGPVRHLDVLAALRAELGAPRSANCR
jgi:hypothetical protein